MRIIIGAGAVWFIYLKLKDYPFAILDVKFMLEFQYEYLLLAVLLLFLNWGIEAKKWQFLIKETIKIKLFSAFKKVMTGITVGFVTPNRIGEIPARAVLLNDKNNLKDLVVKTSVGAYSQLVVTMFFGTLAVLISSDLFELRGVVYIKLLLILITVIMILSYFFQKHLVKVFYKIGYIKRKKLLDGLSHYKRGELTFVLFLSILRYLVFSLQFFIVLLAFNFHFFSWTELMLIPLCFMIASLIPTILLSEIGVRGSVALFVFGAVSNMDVQIVLASTLLWLINVVVPAIFGVFSLNEFKLLKED